MPPDPPPGPRLLLPGDADWPSAAFEGMPDPPAALHLLGRLPPDGAPAVAVVGTRRAGPYGARVARRMAKDLAAAGVWVVSGLALGIDTEAHEGAAEAAAAGGAGTVGVLGCGLDVPYPVGNLEVRERIARVGGILTEHPPGTPALRHHFPHRNRIVAALARVVVVVEAPARSGALITARLALEMGRDVLAVPGPVGGPSHEGCHRLVQRAGAGLCTSAEDVLEVLGLPRRAGADAPPLLPPPDGPALLVWRALDPAEPRDPDALCRLTGLGAADVARALTWLEVEGRAARVADVGFLRAR